MISGANNVNQKQFGKFNFITPSFKSCLASVSLVPGQCYSSQDTERSRSYSRSTERCIRHYYQPTILSVVSRLLLAACTIFFMRLCTNIRGTRWCSLLRHCATSRKVAGSIPDSVTGIFHCQNPSGRTMALGLTQPLTEMSTRNISSGVKAAGAQG